MKIILLFVASIIYSGQSIAQNAPDFTVTDTEGQVHHLYADYLNQGKTVLIKIFFTTCPPCNSIAPLMEPFYQEWGAGEYDVEFFEMTDKSFDTNSLVSAYAAQYSETFPAISMEGGSLTAVAPYKNGSFGTWYGTPNFIVIAPDGDVQYDVKGSGNQATINAINTALLATGAQKPNSETPVAVTGSVFFFNGNVGVNDAYVQILDVNDVIVESDTTGTDGSFGIDVFLSEVEPGWKMRVIKNGSPQNGVNALDLVRIQKHLLNLEPLTDPLYKLASDANNSQTTSSLDIVTLLKLLLGKISHFPDGESWIVIPADTDFGIPNQHPPVIQGTTILLSDILSGERAPVWKAIKKGDVNGSADPD